MTAAPPTRAVHRPRCPCHWRGLALGRGRRGNREAPERDRGAACQPPRSAMSGGADPHVAVGYVPASDRPEVAATAAGTRSVTACGWLIIATCELTKTMVG